MKLANTAIIGSYASDKLLLLGYDVQRSNERSLQQTKNKKVIGDFRQNIRISLDGRLTCTTFDELEEEIQLLLAALNKQVINLVIGATPDRFYRVSWSGVGLPRRANAGGPNAPFSLEFDCIDEGAFVGVPVSYGAATLLDVPFLVSQKGRPVEPVTLIDHRTFFSQGTKLWNTAENTGLAVVNGSVSLTVAGTVVKSWSVPIKASYDLGVVFHDTKTVVYVDGRSYVVNKGYLTQTCILDTVSVSFVGAFPFVATDDYMVYLATLTGESIIKGKKLSGSSLTFRYEGADKTPASIYSTSSIAYNGLTFGDFGARFNSPSNSWFNFNTIESSISSGVDDALDSISYNGRFTLLPRLIKGNNTLTKTEGSGTVYIFWRDMVK